jgi:lysozyme
MSGVPINPIVVDLSHYEWPCDLTRVKANGIVGIIWKATQGSTYQDKTYQEARKVAKGEGFLWGSYHFGDNSTIIDQVNNYLGYAQPTVDELIALDWEPNTGAGGGGQMDVAGATQWIKQAENGLNRVEEMVVYSGNTAKEMISGKNVFFGARRLWLAQYGEVPVIQASWSSYWLWQYTDGESGPKPHSVDGIGDCDISTYPDDVGQLRAEWGGGKTAVIGPPPVIAAGTVNITISAPTGVVVLVNGKAI